jgi:hypothetical protein
MKPERIETEVEYDNVIIEVIGDYYPKWVSNDYDVPDDPAELIVEYFKVGGVDIGCLLSHTQEQCIIDLALENIEN